MADPARRALIRLHRPADLAAPPAESAAPPAPPAESAALPTAPVAKHLPRVLSPWPAESADRHRDLPDRLRVEPWS
jgi:hypothetical protein